MRVYGCLYLCVGPAMDLQPVQGEWLGSLTAFLTSHWETNLLLHNVETLSDCVEEESCVSIISTPVNLEHHETYSLDTEGSCLIQEPKILTNKEKLSPQGIKVKRNGH